MLSVDEFLSKIGVPYEKLEEEERETLLGWLKNLSERQLSLEDVKTNVRKMADGVARELSEPELPKKKDIFLKARLRNYLLVLDFLTGPEEAKKGLERYMKNIKLQKGRVKEVLIK